MSSELTLAERQEARDTNQWRALRLRAGLSQPAWAKELGVVERTVSRWETDAVEPPLSMQKFMKVLAMKKRK